MAIFVCPLSKLPESLVSQKPARVISILDPGSSFPELGPAYVGRHLCLEFHDIHLPTLNFIMPAATHVDRLLRFLKRWDPADPLLIHCRAGIGRSPAVAYIAACYHNPDVSELEIATQLIKASSISRPNKTLIRIADNAMAREGQMFGAIDTLLRNLPAIDVAEGLPFQMPSTFSRSSE